MPPCDSARAHAMQHHPNRCRQSATDQQCTIDSTYAYVYCVNLFGKSTRNSECYGEVATAAIIDVYFSLNIGDISVFVATIVAAACSSMQHQHAKEILAAVSNAPAILYIQRRTAARFYTRALILCRQLSVVHGYTYNILHYRRGRGPYSNHCPVLPHGKWAHTLPC